MASRQLRTAHCALPGSDTKDYKDYKDHKDRNDGKDRDKLLPVAGSSQLQCSE